jgi:DnaJ-class molecular chaperone
MKICTYCNGTGVNHYDDHDVCPVCDGYGIIEDSIIDPEDAEESE